MNKKQLRILVAPLDWGMGHLTRCVPIISYLQAEGHQIVFAGNESQQSFMRSIFSGLEYLSLDGYNVRFLNSKIGFLPQIMLQIPKVKRSIKKENKWLQEQVIESRIDAVISDNRYGLYSKHIPCVFMTHQLGIRSGLHKLLDNILLKIHFRFIEKFTQCWVVDIAEDDGLSGVLAHPAIKPKIKTQYIGLLSQCIEFKNKIEVTEEENYILILLSGAEPQRTQLANNLWKKAIKSDHKIIFVSGTTAAAIPTNIPEHISYHQRLSATDLYIAIKAASIVICRSGYSSLMDLVALNKKAILIPSPGQTEQEYLAKRMHQKGYFLAASQLKFDIQTSVLNAAVFPFKEKAFATSFLKHQQILKDWVDTLKAIKTA